MVTLNILAGYLGAVSWRLAGILKAPTPDTSNTRKYLRHVYEFSRLTQNHSIIMDIFTSTTRVDSSRRMALE
jgi:hypothetical protein